ncbi:hypothetical protein [Nannocystis punicea]|uniref:Uncharacterized protein n=1 Tax=Nannocystis punicea TaxID=2995304 RepID=A0ABY7GYI0_9BACT|nr:hypothetical protein [Nannocystis poenicansa]WAS91945.1 hypothetical protein O0S08_37670 [Nannocystis poenicansa]
MRRIWLVGQIRASAQGEKRLFIDRLLKFVDVEDGDELLAMALLELDLVTVKGVSSDLKRILRENPDASPAQLKVLFEKALANKGNGHEVDGRMTSIASTFFAKKCFGLQGRN